MVISDGAIKLSKVTAAGNGEDGVSSVLLDNLSSLGAAGVTISGYGDFELNSNLGLQIVSHGAITLANINSNFNAKQQAFLDFVLSHYVAVGVEELEQQKLTPLLRLKYHDSLADAVADLGPPEQIGQVFAGFQKYLYAAVA